MSGSPYFRLNTKKDGRERLRERHRIRRLEATFLPCVHLRELGSQYVSVIDCKIAA
jgi:hypothetical protein